MSELESGEAPEVSDVNENQLQAEAESAPAEASNEVKEEVVDESEQLRKAMAEKAFKEREARRRADELEKRLKELESKDSSVVNVPEMPDPFDDDYSQKMAARDEALLKKARFDAVEANRIEQQAITQRDNERKEYERLQALQSQFAENGKRLGVDSKALDEAQDALISYGVSGELATTLLNDPEGPLLVQYLAANPLDLYDITNANPLQAGLLLGKAKSKVSSLKPKPSSAPDPATVLEGRGVPKKERGPAGAVYNYR